MESILHPWIGCTAGDELAHTECGETGNGVTINIYFSNDLSLIICTAAAGRFRRVANAFASAERKIRAILVARAVELSQLLFVFQRIELIHKKYLY